VLLAPLMSGDDPNCESLRLADLFAAGVEKKLAVFGLACVGGGEGSSMKDVHSESRCLLIFVSLTGFAQIGQCTIGSWTEDVLIV
jgi:hypothetical protein